jgi:hypothetical protein
MNFTFYKQKVLLVLAIALSVSMSSLYAGEGAINHLNHEHERDNLGGGNVLPANAKSHGYSLSKMAKLTAAFNVTDHSGVTPDVVNGEPFQGLFTTATNTFIVEPGTTLYVPVWQLDDSDPVLGTFPNVANRQAVENYAFSSNQFGIQYSNIKVDKKVTSLGSNYLAAVTLDDPLTDFLPGGHGGYHYITLAVFLSPLTKGTHTVEISGLATGAAIAPWCSILNVFYGATVCTNQYGPWSITYTVIVQ